MRIYKYPIAITSEQLLEVPRVFQPLSAGLDPQGRPCIWAAVDPDAPTKEIRVFVVGTGQIAPPSKYLNTFGQSSFIWHVFIE